MDVTARRLGWTPKDGPPEYVSGELVILEAEAGGYATHVVDGYTVDPESLEALRWAEQHPDPATTSRPPSSAPTQGPPSAAP